ncbi:IQ domain-containing protein IQM4-like isoform X2 [Setaria italica]|uniref:IQ domain-containing protein IQM4-like isoform X2 n=1 Tax=Setaria italica TaxID=4555 RepID=UPI000BE5B6C2|nr:IQ domain-containing protein IQM4-like isoform X2 [Setaria italica]
MGVLFSCPADDYDPLDMEEAPPAGTSGGGAVLKALGSGKLHIEGSLSFKRAQAASGALHVETEISIRAGDAAAPAPEPAGPLPREVARARFTEPAVESPKHEAAALRLQKVYKSFRTRRQLADCAVLVEQSWWKLLDFALLKRSSVSFFDIEKQETAMSKWSRARTRAAKVGKGLLKDDKAQKLALQHWLEAIDPRHRYGHNLHYYYDCWLQCESKQPFFYWLDIGEGREINLEGKCPRSKLLSQCIKYLGPKEREDYEVVIEDGKFLYKKSGRILDTSCGPRDAKWIFVLSTSKILYVGQKRKGVFQHSSFLAGGATSAAGRLVVENGTLKAIWPHSGHYRPTEENFQEFQSFLKDNMVDLTEVKKCEEETAMARPDSSEDDQEAAEEQAPVPREKILERINSKKEMKSYQLGKQLSFKWTTGAGPRIGCVRDYPSELQVQALEQVNLSPRCGSTAAASRFASPLRRSFNQPAAAAPRGCDASTPRGASRSPLQHGTPAVEAAAD